MTESQYYLPSILLSSALCRSGFCCASLLRSSFAHTMKAFMGRRMRGSLFPRFWLPEPEAHGSLLTLVSPRGLRGSTHWQCPIPGIMTDIVHLAWV